MRSQLDGRISGVGTTLAFVEFEEVYEDKKFKRVTMPHEAKGEKGFDEMCKKLSGKVTTYFLEGYKNNNNKGEF